MHWRRWVDTARDSAALPIRVATTRVGDCRRLRSGIHATRTIEVESRMLAQPALELYSELDALAVAVAGAVQGWPLAGVSAYRHDAMAPLAWSSPRARLVEQTNTLCLSSPGLTAARSAQPVLVADQAFEDSWDECPIELRCLGIRAMLSHPVCVAGAVTAVVSIYADRPNIFGLGTEYSPWAVTTFAAQAIAEIDNQPT